jgi:hypothetical protein
MTRKDVDMNATDVKVHHTKGCPIDERTDQHTHTQGDWRAAVDAADWRNSGKR